MQVAFHLQPAEPVKDNPNTHGRLIYLRTSHSKEVLKTIHTCTGLYINVCSYVPNGGEI